jgi:hypothetical protein
MNGLANSRARFGISSAFLDFSTSYKAENSLLSASSLIALGGPKCSSIGHGGFLDAAGLAFNDSMRSICQKDKCHLFENRGAPSSRNVPQNWPLTQRRLATA